MAGVSRQAVSAVESGLSDPSLRVALALARALGHDGGGGVRARHARPGDRRPAAGAAGDGGAARVTLAEIGDTFVALPLAGAAVSQGRFRARPTGWPRFRAGRCRRRPVRPLSPPRPTLVVAGCDPAFPLLEAPLALLDPPVSFAWWPCASGAALELAAAGLVHAAGRTCAAGPATTTSAQPREPPCRRAPRCMGSARGARASCSGPGWPPACPAWSTWSKRRAAAGQPGARLGGAAAARPGAGRDRGRARAIWPGTRARPLAIWTSASAIAAGLADVGVASEPAALAYGLDFVPLAAEQFDLVIPAGQAGSREVPGLLKVLSSRWLLDQLATLPGYDPAPCGEHIATLLPLRP